MPGGAGSTSIGGGRGLLRRPNRPGLRRRHLGGRDLNGRDPGAPEPSGLTLSNPGSRSDLDGPGSFGNSAGLGTPGIISSPSGAGDPNRPAGHSGPSGLGNLRTLGIPAGLANRRMLLAGVAVVVIVAVGAYLAFGGQQPAKSTGRGPSTGDKAKPTVHMLTAGQTGKRASVPWKVVGPGWTLAELSAAQPDANSAASDTGALTLDLVDPEGGKYVMHTWTGASVTLLAWSGNAKHALLRFESSPPGPQPPAYGVLTLATGHISNLQLKADVTPVNFTRPNGLNILAIRRTARKFELRRYDLLGNYQATLSTMPDRQAAASQPGTCPSLCNALSSPNGFQAVWGVAGNEMQLVNNGGGLIHRLRVPASGTPPSCVPVSWWNADTVLANCAAPGQPSADSERLWLVPADGTAATALAPPTGGPSGAGFDAAAWMANGHVYLTQTSATQCSTSARGAGGLAIMAVGQGEPTAVSVPHSTDNYDDVVGAMGSRLLVLAQTSCPGTSSLLWFSPSARTSTFVLRAPAGELGVVAAVPYRGAPTAYSLG